MSVFLNSTTTVPTHRHLLSQEVMESTPYTRAGIRWAFEGRADVIIVLPGSGPPDTSRIKCLTAVLFVDDGFSSKCQSASVSTIVRTLQHPWVVGVWVENL